jgi:hypothetical protein
MIRIDEIYENTFLPWVRKNLPTTSIFYCDPFGSSDPDSICYKSPMNPAEENSAIFFFDQEPIQLTKHITTFDRFLLYTGRLDASKKFIVSSETDSDDIDYISKRFKLRPFYYFFHGWAALDWYRGYDKTFLIAPLDQRKIKKTFFSPNRIIGGERKHRVLSLYHMARANLLDNNNVSAPAICPVENQSIIEIAAYYKYFWPDPQTGIVDTLSQINFPKLFPGEDVQRMSSCWLDQFDLATESLVYHVSETVYFGRRQHLTEKTFKPIAMGMPFILNAPAGSLAYLRKYGFRTFDGIWSESYDKNTDDLRRLADTTGILRFLDRLSLEQKQKIFEECIPIIEHNWNHFYGGGFEKILWAELTTMLNNLKAAAQGDLSSN